MPWDGTREGCGAWGVACISAGCDNNGMVLLVVWGESARACLVECPDAMTLGLVASG